MDRQRLFLSSKRNIFILLSMNYQYAFVVVIHRNVHNHVL